MRTFALPVDRTRLHLLPKTLASEATGPRVVVAQYSTFFGIDNVSLSVNEGRTEIRAVTKLFTPLQQSA